MQRYRLTESGVCDCLLPNENGAWVKYEEIVEVLQQAHRDATEEVAKAHKRGWEQAKEKCVKISMGMFDCNGEEVANAIAAMEYGGKAND